MNARVGLGVVQWVSAIGFGISLLLGFMGLYADPKDAFHQEMGREYLVYFLVIFTVATSVERIAEVLKR